MSELLTHNPVIDPDFGDTPFSWFGDDVSPEAIYVPNPRQAGELDIHPEQHSISFDAMIATIAAGANDDRPSWFEAQPPQSETDPDAHQQLLERVLTGLKKIGITDTEVATTPDSAEEPPTVPQLQPARPDWPPRQPDNSTPTFHELFEEIAVDPTADIEWPTEEPPEQAPNPDIQAETRLASTGAPHAAGPLPDRPDLFWRRSPGTHMNPRLKGQLPAVVHRPELPSRALSRIDAYYPGQPTTDLEVAVQAYIRRRQLAQQYGSYRLPQPSQPEASYSLAQPKPFTERFAGIVTSVRQAIVPRRRNLSFIDLGQA